MNGILKNKIGKKIFESAFGTAWVKEKVRRFIEHVSKEENILDIGCGSCNIAYLLKKEGYNVIPVDVADMSFFPEVKPIVYDGRKLPFADDAFDTSLLLTVLHHTSSPEALLQEAVRVSNKVIIIEDIYFGVFQQYLTYFADTLVNMGFSKMTYQNKTAVEWRTLFQQMALKPVSFRYDRVLFFFMQATYILKREKDKD